MTKAATKFAMTMTGHTEQTAKDWIEEEVGKRFPDDAKLEPGRLRVRVAKLCFDLLDLARKKALCAKQLGAAEERAHVIAQLKYSIEVLHNGNGPRDEEIAAFLCMEVQRIERGGHVVKPEEKEETLT